MIPRRAADCAVRGESAPHVDCTDRQHRRQHGGYELPKRLAPRRAHECGACPDGFHERVLTFDEATPRRACAPDGTPLWFAPAAYFASAS